MRICIWTNSSIAMILMPKYIHNLYMRLTGTFNNEEVSFLHFSIFEISFNQICLVHKVCARMAKNRAKMAKLPVTVSHIQSSLTKMEYDFTQ